MGMSESVPQYNRWPGIPALRIAVIFAAGLLINRLYPPPTPEMMLLVATAVSILWLISEFGTGKMCGLNRYLSGSFCYLLLLFICGYARGEYARTELESEKRDASYVNLHTGELLEMSGVITESGQSHRGQPVLTVRVDQAASEEVVWALDISIRVYANSGNERELHDFEIRERDRVILVVRILELNSPGNPGQFDYKEWLHSNGIVSHGLLVDVVEAESPSHWVSWPYKLRSWFHSQIDERFSEKPDLAKALLTGERNRLDPGVQESFSRAGIAHLMAVSGLHVGFVVAPLWFLYRLLPPSQIVRILYLLVLSLLLVGYAAIASFSASVLRASIMAWILIYSFASFKPGLSLNLLGCAALVLLMIDPGQISSIGFQLSFFSVAAILYCLPDAKKVVSAKVKSKLGENLCLLIVINSVVQLSLFPLLVGYFGEISLISPVINLLAVPVMAVVVPVSIILMILPDGFISWFDSVILLLDWMLKQVTDVADRVTENNWSWIGIHEPSPFLFLYWLFGSLYLLPRLNSSSRVILLYLLTLLTLTWSVLRWVDSTVPPDMTITVLDVGQGDAIHINTPGGKNLLIDTGAWTPYGSSGERVIVPYLESEGVERIDAVVLTHPHADHIGGLPDIMNAVYIDAIYSCGNRAESEVFHTYKRTADRLNIPISHVGKGDRLTLDSSIRIFVMGAGAELSAGDPNNYSVILLIVYGNHRFLFTGDAEKRQEERVKMTYGGLLNADFLKAAHHGSRTSSTNTFLNAVTPRASVVSSGYRNRFGHPHREALDRLYHASDTVHFTALSGAVRYRSNGYELEYVE